MADKSIPTPIRIWLRDAAEQLSEVGITSALLDAELILAHTLRKSRTWLHAHDDESIAERQIEIANARLDLRLDRTPIAYIIGHKEFYGRLFKVTPAVLIPRPESETIINLLNKYILPHHNRLIDIGTGSGCLGITAKLEHPNLDVTLTDISNHALKVAKLNSSNLHAEVKIVKSNLFDKAIGPFDIVIANLPYVDSSWERSPETNFEPALALFAKSNGLGLIFKMLVQLPDIIAPKGYVFIEADPCQHDAIIEYAQAQHLQHIETNGYVIVLINNQSN